MTKLEQRLYNKVDKIGTGEGNKMTKEQIKQQFIESFGEEKWEIEESQDNVEETEKEKADAIEDALRYYKVI